MPDVDGTLAEIDYALDQLRADGIQLMTSYGERYPGHPDFAPVMDELNRRKALVFVHPLAPVCCAPSLAWIQPALFEFTQDTNRCVFSPLFTGTLARFPDVRFIFCHSGAAVPVLAGRAAALGFDREFADKMPNGIDYELRKLHYDVALQANRPALAALCLRLNIAGSARQRFSVWYVSRRHSWPRGIWPKAWRSRRHLSRHG
jgi:hypothetical protein